MDPVITFVYDELDIRVVMGRGAVASLGEVLDTASRSRALVVCGPHVGSNPEVIDPIVAGLGPRHVGTFQQTSTRKTARSVFDAIAAMREADADVLVGVGGGSSLDTVRQMSVFAREGRSLEEYVGLARSGDLRAPRSGPDCTPVVVVPTTLAGADLQSGGSVEFLTADESPTGMPLRVSARLAPLAAFYDPNLVATSPSSALFGSAMNGFNKGLETIYAARTTPVSDATAVRGLQLLRRGLLRLAEGDLSAMDGVVEGILLVQVQLQTSIIHAFGHGFSRQFPVQQGHIHAIIGPHVLRSVVGRLHGRRRELLAEGLDLPPTDAAASTEAIVGRVEALRDAMGLPTRLSDLIDADDFDLDRTAAYIRGDATIEKADPALLPTTDEIAAVLQAAW